jgi:hypothetical protein
VRPVGIHVRTGAQGDGEKTYAIGVPRALAERIRFDTFLPELLPGGTLVFRPMVPIYERVEEE